MKYITNPVIRLLSN